MDLSLVSLPISVFQMYTRMNYNFTQARAWVKYKIRVLLDPDQLCHHNSFDSFYKHAVDPQVTKIL